MTVRHVTLDDAAALLELKRALDGETAFMMFEPGERMATVVGQRAELEQLSARDNAATFVAEGHGELAGYLEAEGGTFRRNRHAAHIIVGVRQRYAGRGLGTALFEAAEAWARERGLRRLELTVMVHNAAGVGLYQKLGFVIEGTRRDSLLVDGAFVDEYAMAKILRS